MRVVVLTTETAHHTYFLRELTRTVPVERVIVERRQAKPAFETAAAFERDRDEYERQAFFDGRSVSLSDVADVLDVDSANDPSSVSCLKRLQSEIVLVFGAGRLQPSIIQLCPLGMVNLHGGDPEEYRGLDTHLWAVYHGDFGGLVTTLHRVNEKLDDGDIVLQAAIPLQRGMPLHELRHRNTQVCVRLALSAIDMYQRHGGFLSRPQRRRGRYYSFMPAALKGICRERFEAYTGKLP